jgi:hypothetical protein
MVNRSEPEGVPRSCICQGDSDRWIGVEQVASLRKCTYEHGECGALFNRIAFDLGDV